MHPIRSFRHCGQYVLNGSISHYDNCSARLRGQLMRSLGRTLECYTRKSNVGISCLFDGSLVHSLSLQSKSIASSPELS